MKETEIETMLFTQKQQNIAELINTNKPKETQIIFEAAKAGDNMETTISQKSGKQLKTDATKMQKQAVFIPFDIYMN